MSHPTDQIRRLLSELNDALILEGAEPVQWVICGGTALGLLGLLSRTTRDVDVLGERAAGGIEVIATDFPEGAKRAIQRVADAHRELQAPGPPWVNCGPARILELGLPDGFAGRLTELRMGERLTLHVPSRTDLVALKLFAAADDLGPRQAVHSADLRAIDPSAQEIESAIRWIEGLPDPHHRIRVALKSIVEELGHDDLAHYIVV